MVEDIHQKEAKKDKLKNVKLTYRAKETWFPFFYV